VTKHQIKSVDWIAIQTVIALITGHVSCGVVSLRNRSTFLPESKYPLKAKARHKMKDWRVFAEDRPGRRPDLSWYERKYAQKWSNSEGICEENSILSRSPMILARSTACFRIAIERSFPLRSAG